ncbi:hypothetical protein [Telluribacter sp.]|uniref:hypothetical protein n=1 Tax=Telluribacter sp. TaxID=1978767 RepID=UPI002E0FA223|nr:hypothetical protein [Telluribacter sp.]
MLIKFKPFIFEVGLKMMNVGMTEDLNYSQAKERLLFLIQSRVYKGRFELLYKLFKKEIHELSLQGASKLISKELGNPIGVQTIRTLRKKSHQLKKSVESNGYTESSFRGVSPTAAGEASPVGNSTPGVSEIENFKPIDVFDKEYKKESSLIKWVK